MCILLAFNLCLCWATWTGSTKGMWMIWNKRGSDVYDFYLQHNVWWWHNPLPSSDGWRVHEKWIHSLSSEPLEQKCNRFIHRWAQNLNRTDDAGAETRVFFKTTARNYLMSNFRALCIYDYSFKNCVRVKIPLLSAAASNHIFSTHKKKQK